MTSPNIGPAARQMADAMKAGEKQVRSAIDRLRRKIRDRLTPKQRDRFDKKWQDAKDTAEQGDAAADMHRRVLEKVAAAGGMVDPEYAQILADLQTLMDMLQGLQTLETLENHFDTLAKAYGS
jgi:predicted outer membrane protein